MNTLENIKLLLQNIIQLLSLKVEIIQTKLKLFLKTKLLKIMCMVAAFIVFLFGLSYLFVALNQLIKTFVNTDYQASFLTAIVIFIIGSLILFSDKIISSKT